MEELAELIFQKLLNRQAEFDQQFIQQMKESGQEFTVEINDYVKKPETEEDKKQIEEAFYREGLIQELERLKSLLAYNLDSENFEACESISKNIKEIESKLKEL